ncbi:MAG TPA: hypothetical protein VHB20_06860 [Verrucomicrobiae bacterium]|jgi:hypothetical protein|nr:hypothetical protein [Verrucomicrobiae bacterium]
MNIPNLALRVLSIGWISASAHAASLVVAAANSSPESRARADLVCSGHGDQATLLASLTKAPRIKTVFERNPRTLEPTECYGGYSVEWLPGDYYLDGTLTVPDMEDCAIHAEGSRFHYLLPTGDAVVLTGLSRDRFYFGTIFTDTTGAALRIKPTEKMPSLMSLVNFTGLIGANQRGVGLCVDSTVENVCTMRFEGTDIRGFDIGVFVPDARAPRPGQQGSGKTDTDWYWFSYVRMCHTCIWEQRTGIDCGNWNVNVDASISNSVAVRTAGSFGKWFIIMGTMDWHFRPHEGNQTKSIVLDPGANHNVIEVTPPLDKFAPAVDRSGVTNNVVFYGGQAHSLPMEPSQP